MRKTIYKISAIFGLILLYCFLESWYYHEFYSEIRERTLEIQSTTQESDLQERCTDLEEYIEKNRILTEIMLPKTELEQIDISMGHMKDYLAEGQLFEARVAAGEVRGYLEAINDGITLKK